MTAHLHSVAVVVDDQEAALDFYTRVIGWTKREDAMMGPDFRFLVVVPPGHSTGINLAPPSIMCRPAPGADTPADVGINLFTDDLRRDHEAWTAQGVVFGMAPEPMPWGGLGGRFQDPWGNRFFITDGSN